MVDNKIIEVKYQVTLFSQSGKYRPISCVTVLRQSEDVDLSNDKEIKKKLIAQGVQKICASRRWGKLEINTYGYLKARVRKYEPEKFEAEAKARYEKIKEEKYSTGEWKRPKNKN